MVSNKATGRRALLFACALLAPSAAGAQQILTAIQSEFDDNGPADTQISSLAGQQLSTSFGGADTRALTNYGVNKIFASGTADYEQYATSAWLDTYTVGGAAGTMVDLSFNFTVDGAANFSGNSAGYNFNVVALRGGNWSMAGSGETSPSIYGPATSGSVNERLILTQTLPSRVTQADLREFGGFYNYANNQGQAGPFQTHVTYREFEDAYSLETLPAGAAVPQETRYYATGFRNFVNGVPQTPFIIPYNVNAATMAQGNIRAQLVANYSLLDLAALCAGEGCEANGVYPPTDLTLSFRMAAGSTFTLATMLYADDVREGTIDFFNTAKVSGITVSNGGTLTSLSGTLTADGNGGFGYPAAAGIPEPATWAMMNAGFGLIGAASRRRPLRINAAASA